jgi:photosynthetic reaction center H subunit
MNTGSLTSQLDVAQLALITFFLFFVGLVIYLQRENNREGLPLVDDYGRKTDKRGMSGMPSDKVYIVPHGENVVTPRREAETVFRNSNEAAFISAPLEPTGNKLLSGMGPAAFALRADRPDAQFIDGSPRIVPLRVAPLHSLATEDDDPRGMNVVGADDKVAGTVSEVWIDRSEGLVRYFEVALVPELGGRHVLVPSTMVDIQGKSGRVKCYLILGAQFADVPGLKNPDEVTLLEEDKISAYYAGGMLYATPARAEPLI